jgi:hypothetical protein
MRDPNVRVFSSILTDSTIMKQETRLLIPLERTKVVEHNTKSAWACKSSPSQEVSPG